MKKILFSLLLVMTGCQTANLTYRVNPDLSPLQQLQSQAEMIAINVVDKTESTAQNSNSLRTEKPITESIQEQLKKAATAAGMKLIANPLLADLGLTLEIEVFDVSLNASTFSSEMKVKSQLNLQLQKKSRSYQKRFISSRTQEVANPVNNNDITGIVNQILSEQFAAALNDSDIQQFVQQVVDEQSF